ncbi:MAG: aldolase/citrate lyase family protein [Candidatus Borkfalkiaceae bacterium]|nr:aldolase/citrate lyase family protein [Clostridia bacterium]MDY6222558.1 aldolase/citrate lyase family protein [Christensenellaceae bacterium]
MNKRGIMLSEIAFAHFPVLFKNNGLDFFIVDCEHGGFDYADVARIVMNARLANIFVMIRLPNNMRKDIIKYMDMGADGLLLPMTNTAADIAQVVKFAKYPPIGQRGISTMRAHTLYAPPKTEEYLPTANARTKVYAQIETRKGLENVREILNTAGVDGCFFGPNDFSADCGCLNNGNAPQALEAISEIGRAATNTQKTAGIITNNKNYLNAAKTCGFELYSVGSELGAIAEYCKKITI